MATAQSVPHNLSPQHGDDRSLAEICHLDDCSTNNCMCCFCHSKHCCHYPDIYSSRKLIHNQLEALRSWHKLMKCYGIEALCGIWEMAQRIYFLCKTLVLWLSKIPFEIQIDVLYEQQMGFQLFRVMLKIELKTRKNQILIKTKD